jgi:hypothetical protein
MIWSVPAAIDSARPAIRGASDDGPDFKSVASAAVAPPKSEALLNGAR